MHRNGIKGVSVSHRPRCTNLGLHIGDEYVGDKVVACDAGENGVDVVLVDRGGQEVGLCIYSGKIADLMLTCGTS